MHEQHRGERVAAELLRQHGLSRLALPAPRGRATGIFAAVAGCLFLASVLILFLQVRGFVGHLETRLSAETGGDIRLEAMNQHMDALQSKFNALLTESVEVRLKALEQSVEAGKVGTDDLRTFESLKADLKTLESYALRSGAMDLDYAQREHRRYQSVPASPPVLRNAVLRGELAELKALFYGCLAVFAVALIAAFGYWSNQRRNIRRLELMAAFPLLANRASDDPR